MKRFDDLLPEEREPQHEELITLLQRAYRRPAPVPPTEQEEVITQVRERLVKADHGDSFNGDRPIPQIGVLDSSPHKAVSPPGKPHRDRRRFRLMALLAAAMIIAVLLGTPLILLRHSSTGVSRHSSTGGTGGLPTLTLSPHAARVGDSITFTLKHVTPSASVALTHDIQEPILINGSSFITTNKQGTARFSVVIDKNWGPGFHQIVAEDVVTRNIASANLQITGQGPTPPPHLLVDSSSIHMGADVVGANTIRSFNLVNSGGGSITWSASSNQPWLLVSPSHGSFSQKQTISLTTQRVGLKPGDYGGSITISTNIGSPQRIEVEMTVLPLPRNVGPVIAVAPALLSFTATDGGSDSPSQALTISNPGSRPLNWSFALTQGSMCNWLSATPNSGIVAAGATSTLHVIVKNRCLLPGVYLGTLKFTAAGALNGTQVVNVSMTMQPHCGLISSAGYLAFTVVQGQSNPTNQTLSLNAASCSGIPTSWTTTSIPSWLTITPASGQLRGTANTMVSVSVNTAGLIPNVYSSAFSFVTGQSTLTVPVQLTIQAVPPQQIIPILSAAPLSLNFSNMQGQPSPTGQVVTITNNGGSALKWYASPPPQLFSWLGASPLGNPAPGSPQTITVTLVVQPPCTMSPPSASALSFSAVQGASVNPPEQIVVFTSWGNCVWPETWTTSVVPAAPWLTLTPSSGAVKGTGQSGSLGVSATIAGLPTGTYTTQVTISARDASGALVQGSPQTFSVTLTVTGYTVSGTVFACPGSTPPTCTTPQALPGAILTLTGGSTTLNATADGAGNYAIAGAALGTYTVTASGTDANSVHYVGTVTVTMTGDTPNVTIQVFPG